jgi:DNA-binding protein HU-beta
MNKTELIDTIATSVEGVTKADVSRIIAAFTDVIASQLTKGEQVTMPGFGSFKVGARSAREGRNPRTGETIKIKAARVPKFSPGEGLKKAVNETA